MSAPFDLALTAAVEASTVPRDVFARRLGVREATFTAWLDGTEAPGRGDLHLLVQMLRDNPNAADALQVLEEVLDRPASEVTTHVRRMHPRPGVYMLEGLRLNYLARLTSLPAREQERLLLQHIEEASKSPLRER